MQERIVICIVLDTDQAILGNRDDHEIPGLVQRNRRTPWFDDELLDRGNLASLRLVLARASAAWFRFLHRQRLDLCQKLRHLFAPDQIDYLHLLSKRTNLFRRHITQDRALAQ